jgi:hypothetical protein
MYGKKVRKKIWGKKEGKKCGRRREHPQPIICTTTKKKVRKKKVQGKQYGKKNGGDIRKNSTGKKYGKNTGKNTGGTYGKIVREKYGKKRVWGKSKGESADVVEITPTNMLYYY